MPDRGLVSSARVLAARRPALVWLVGGLGGRLDRAPRRPARRRRPDPLPGSGIEPRGRRSPSRRAPRSSIATPSFGARATTWRPPGSRSPAIFPHSHEWISPAYLQLGRALYRQSDVDRLAALQRELCGLGGGQDARQGARPRSSKPAVKLLNERSRRRDRGDRAGSSTPDAIDDRHLRSRAARVLRRDRADALAGRPAAGATAARSKRRPLAEIQALLTGRSRCCRRSGRPIVGMGRCGDRSACDRDRRVRVRVCGVNGHGIPEARQRRDRRTDHRAEAGPDRDRPVARALPRRARPQRRQPPARRDLPQGRGVLSSPTSTPGT